MRSHREIDPRHAAKGKTYRWVGLGMIGVAIYCLLAGFHSTFIDTPRQRIHRDVLPPGFPSHGFPGRITVTDRTPAPRGKFWMMFLGLPLLGVGLVAIVWGNKLATTRDRARRRPAATGHTGFTPTPMPDPVQTEAKAVTPPAATPGGTGSRSPVPEWAVVRCGQCNAENDAHAKYCSRCGTSMGNSKLCKSCNKLNDPDAKFCDKCGSAFL